MTRKFVFSIFLLLIFFQVSCVSQAYRPNTHIKIHDSNTVYGVDVLGQSKSFTKGKIYSARDVQVQWQEPEKDTDGKETGKEVDVRSFATEFVIEPDGSETFIFVQYNEEQLKAGERVLLLKENNKIRIVPTGLEPVTPRLGIWCSILMSYGGNLFNYSKFYSKLIKVYKD